MWKDVLETYRCLISCRKNLPGMPLEDAFSELSPIKQEYEWLKQKAAEEGFDLKEQDKLDKDAEWKGV